MLKRIVLATALIALILAIAGCQAVQGLGKDIEWTGQKGAETLGGE